MTTSNYILYEASYKLNKDTKLSLDLLESENIPENIGISHWIILLSGKYEFFGTKYYLWILECFLWFLVQMIQSHWPLVIWEGS